MIRLDPDVKRAVELAAKNDHRSLSAFIVKILADWLEAQKPAKGSESRR
jgi:hypothetical protein